MYKKYGGVFSFKRLTIWIEWKIHPDRGDMSPRGLLGARCWGLICCTVASVIREMVRGSGCEPVVSPRSHAALLSIREGWRPERRGAERSGAERSRAQRHQLCRLRLTEQHGSGEGETGVQHHHGRRRVQQVDRAHPVEESQAVFIRAGPRSA